MRRGPSLQVAAVMQLDEELMILRPGDSVKIGRHPDNDIVISNPGVSRSHMAITWYQEDDWPTAVPGPALNLPLVNGRALVQSTPLRNRSTLTILDNDLRIELRNCGEAAILSDSGDDVALFSDYGPTVSGAVLSGEDLEGVFRNLEAHQRSGALRLITEGSVGFVTFCLGRIMEVKFQHAQKTRALEKILLLRDRIDYEFSSSFEPVEYPLNMWFSAYKKQRARDALLSFSDRKTAKIKGVKG